MVFNVRVKEPQSIAGRSWNRAMDVSPIVPLAFIVLKLTGVDRPGKIRGALLPT
jgi:hypothetical protein